MIKPRSRPSTPIRMNDFTKKVIALIKKIPRGKVATYGQIANLAGKPHGSRGVGWILNSCSESHNLPWQRVINSQGKISFSRRSQQYRTQKRLLLKEKIRFDDRDVISLKEFGWEKRAKKKTSPNSRPRLFS